MGQKPFLGQGTNRGVSNSLAGTQVYYFSPFFSNTDLQVENMEVPQTISYSGMKQNRISMVHDAVTIRPYLGTLCLSIHPTKGYTEESKHLGLNLWTGLHCALKTPAISYKSLMHAPIMWRVNTSPRIGPGTHVLLSLCQVCQNRGLPQAWPCPQAILSSSLRIYACTLSQERAFQRWGVTTKKATPLVSVGWTSSVCKT